MAQRKKTTSRKSSSRSRSSGSRSRSSSTRKRSSSSRSRSRQKSKSPLDNLRSALDRAFNSPKSSRSRSSSSTRSTSRSTGREQTYQRQPSWWSTLSLDRKLDIIGVGMAVVGFLTILAIISANRGGISTAWIKVLTIIFGWGGYVLPAGLVLLGLWLILRNFESLPTLSIERAAGLVSSFLFLLTLMHFALMPIDSTTAFALAKQGQGGGYVGAAIFQLMRAVIGVGGTGILLIGWVILSFALSLDKSVVDLFKWIDPLILRVQDAWDDYQDRRKSRSSAVMSMPKVESAGTVSEVATISQGSVSPQHDPLSASLWNAATTKNWVCPPVEQILDAGVEVTVDDEFDRQRAQLIEETLSAFGAPARVVEINRGPTITQFGVEPDFVETRNKRTRVRVGKIASLADDLALALAATRVRVEAPVPGKGFVGIEVPNDEISQVALRDGIESEAFRRLGERPLRFALGQDVAGNAVAADLAAMPHMLVAGTTGSGKSVCVNAIIACLLINNTPDDLRMLMVDPKRVELTGYDGIPHLLAPVVVEMERVVGALQWATREMDQRYHKFAELGARNIVEYNERQLAKKQRKLPYLVVIIDELADLMMLAPDETERTITRMAQLARATGIHMVISTQRPSVDVVTGLIKANFPARIAFATASGTDSRVILDQPGAERLLGRGDMLFQAPDAPAPVRLQGVFVSEHELLRLVQYWRGLAGYVAPSSVATAAGGVPDALPRGVPLKQMPMFEEVDLEPEEDTDPLFDEALDLIRRQGRASISMLQRRLRIGYTRAARLIEDMEAKGLVSAPQPGSQVRDVLDYGPAAPPVGEE